MPFNGAGVYSPPGADFPAVTQTVISSTHYNNVINDIATGLSLALTKDGQQTATANIPFGGFRATNVGITAIAGSVGTPAINVSDAGTGLYRSAASELAVTVAGTQRGRFDATGLIVTGTVNASTSVVTPLVVSATDVPLDLGINGAAKWRLQPSGANGFAWLPFTDNTQQVGSTANRVSMVFTPIIDSGTTGSLSLRTNNGATQFSATHTANAVNFLSATGSATGAGTATLFAAGTDANVSVQYGALGTGGHSFYSAWGAAVQQFGILHTALSNRWITVTGSNGGNPTISTTAGSLAITPAVVLAGGVSGSLVVTGAISAGSNPATQGDFRGTYTSTGGVWLRNSANSADLSAITAVTVNAVVDVFRMGINSAGIIMKARSGGAAPTTSDLASGEFTVWRDTGGATTKVYYNNAGVIQSVALA